MKMSVGSKIAIVYTFTVCLACGRYWVRIAAFNEVKGSALTYSDLQRVTTREGVPSSPPVINNVLASSSTECRVTFSAPDDRTIMGKPKG